MVFFVYFYNSIAVPWLRPVSFSSRFRLVFVSFSILQRQIGLGGKNLKNAENDKKCVFYLYVWDFFCIFAPKLGYCVKIDGIAI